MQSLHPRLTDIQKQQTNARTAYESEKSIIENRGSGLLNVISEIKISAANAGIIADAVSRGQTTGMGESMLSDQPTTLDAIEEETDLWSLPKVLSNHALHLREKHPDSSREVHLRQPPRNAATCGSQRPMVAPIPSPLAVRLPRYTRAPKTDSDG